MNLETKIPIIHTLAFMRYFNEEMPKLLKKSPISKVSLKNK